MGQLIAKLILCQYYNSIIIINLTLVLYITKLNSKTVYTNSWMYSIIILYHAKGCATYM